MTTVETKPGKNQFKCYKCRRIFGSKDGDWHRWESMEVHLCKECERTTREKPERKS